MLFRSLENNQQNQEVVIFDAQEGEIPAWKALDNVCRKWVALSGFEKDQSDYQKMKEQYQ